MVEELRADSGSLRAFHLLADGAGWRSKREALPELGRWVKSTIDFRSDSPVFWQGRGQEQWPGLTVVRIQI